MNSYSKAFVEGLKTGKCLVRRIFPNVNRPGQINVQFMQRVEKPSDGASLSTLVALAQGIGEDAGFTKVSTVFSFAEKQINSLVGSTNLICYDKDKVLEASRLFGGREINISVVENTTQDERRPNQLPKVNPETGEVLTFKGEPIFRHTSLTDGTPELVFLQHDTLVETSATGNDESAAIEAPF